MGREGSMKMVSKHIRNSLKDAKDAQFEEYAGGSMIEPRSVLVAVFECQGCEPTQLINCGPLIAKTSSGEEMLVESLDVESGWASSYGNADDGRMACITEIESVFRVVK